MIDLNRIRSLKTLESMKKDLNEFLTNETIPLLYEEKYGNLIDYESDIEDVKELMERVEKRMSSLGRYLARSLGRALVKTKVEKKDTSSPESATQVA